MTKSEFLKLQTSKEMWKAILENPGLRKDAEVMQAFNEKRSCEFKENAVDVFGSFDPAMHYDWNKRRQ